MKTKEPIVINSEIRAPADNLWIGGAAVTIPAGAAVRTGPMYLTTAGVQIGVSIQLPNGQWSPVVLLSDVMLKVFTEEEKDVCNTD